MPTYAEPGEGGALPSRDVYPQTLLHTQRLSVVIFDVATTLPQHGHPIFPLPEGVSPQGLREALRPGPSRSGRAFRGDAFRGALMVAGGPCVQHRFPSAAPLRARRRSARAAPGTAPLRAEACREGWIPARPPSERQSCALSPARRSSCRLQALLEMLCGAQRAFTESVLSPSF